MKIKEVIYIKKTNYDYVKEWRKKNPDKVAEYNKKYLYNLQEKAIKKTKDQCDKEIIEYKKLIEEYKKSLNS